jgi:catechol 2,3-dioxygenase-like lactoylglutathione lyase family enzyme
MEQVATVASSVMFVHQLDRSVAFYRDVFTCKVAIRDQDAALLIAPGGFQIYLVSKGSRTPHASGGIGPQYLMWATDSAEALEHMEGALRQHGAPAYRYTSGGVTFIRGRDPDGIRVLIAYPSPEKQPRSLVGPHLYT